MDDISAIFRVSGPDLDRNRITVTRLGIYVGRVGGNDLVLGHSQISRRHMRIFWQDGTFWVEDLGSSNGVWLNTARLEANVPRPISQGDTLRLGPYSMVFEQFVGPGLSEVSTPAEDVPVYAAPTPGLVEAVPVRPRFTNSHLTPAASPARALIPRVKVKDGRRPHGIPTDQSNWLQYLPGIYSDPDLDPTHFIGRYLLIFESVFSPITWMVDNFDLYLSPETAPAEWLQWMASWFDLLLLPELPIERQRAIMRQIGWLFLRRGTRLGLERLLELYFDVKPEIAENVDGPCHFLVRLPLSQSSSGLGREVAERLITSQKPAFTAYTLEVT